MRRILRIVAGLGAGIWTLVVLGLFLMSLALNIATALVPAVAGAVSSAAEAVTGRRSLRGQDQDRELALRRQLATANRRAQTAERALETERRERRALVRALNDRRDRIERQAADARVHYRGNKVRIREAVADTSERVSRRLQRAATRDVASTFGEAIPFLGVGAAVAFTAWELRDSCELMRDIKELDAVFNPDHSIGKDEVCGIQPPSRDDLWQKVKSGPETLWQKAKAFRWSSDPTDPTSGFWRTDWAVWRSTNGNSAELGRASQEPTSDSWWKYLNLNEGHD